ncbi:MAG: ATP-dependent zinc metalloprotease FtsH [Candidatus Dojkabacteria bacterium]|nr:MAG: ATP-dependent zinc metalloprotease FtsH [Candidatus Dojkabacteria bacterium]
MADSKSKEKGSGDIRKISKRKPSNYTIVSTVVIALLILGTWFFLDAYEPTGEEVSYNKIVKETVEGNYEKIIWQESTLILEREAEDERVGATRIHAVLPPNENFYDRMESEGVMTSELKDATFKPDVAINIADIITLVLLGVGIFLIYSMIKGMQSSGGRFMDFGQSKARLIFGKRTGITFNDVAGIEEVKEELIEIVEFLKHPKKFLAIGARIPKGVLLVGPPGTGKTLLAKAVAGEAGVPFFHTSGSEFEEMLVGAGASRVRDLFAKAKKASPCIIFIDEIDAVAKKRGTVVHSGASEQTLNQILVEMDGLESRENVIVLAATNRPDVLDPAILRPGRFDRSVTVHMPDYDGRLQILKVHAKNKKFAADADLERIAKKTIGYSGADLENLLNEAAIAAAKDDRKEISHSDLTEAYLKVRLGRQRKSTRSEEDHKRVAYHEAGHAVVAKLTPHTDPVDKISILSRGSSGGVTVYVPEDDRMMITKDRMLSMIKSSVAGRAAEEVFLGSITTGASSDISQATQVARAMVQRYGMSDKLGFVQYGDPEESAMMGYQYGGLKDHSDHTSRLIDEEVKGIIDEALNYARKVLKDNREVVETLVKLLLEKEEIDRDEFNSLFN